MYKPPLVVDGWRITQQVEPSRIRNRPCRACSKILRFGHALWNPYTQQSILTCGRCATELVRGYDGVATEKAAQDYLDREQVFLNPKHWNKVSSRSIDLWRYAMIGGARYRVTAFKEKPERFRVRLESAANPEHGATNPEVVKSIELAKRLAFKVVNRVRDVVRASGSGLPVGDEYDDQSD